MEPERNRGSDPQDGLRRRAKSTMKGSVFEHMDLAELNMGEDQFSVLANYGGLKQEAKWEGHRRQGCKTII